MEFIEFLAKTKFHDEYKNYQDTGEFDEIEYLKQEQEYAAGQTFEPASPEIFELAPGETFMPVSSENFQGTGTSEVVLDEYPKQQQEVWAETPEISCSNESQSLDASTDVLDVKESFHVNEPPLNENQSLETQNENLNQSKERQEYLEQREHREYLEHREYIIKDTAKCFTKGIHTLSYTDNPVSIPVDVDVFFFFVVCPSHYVCKTDENEIVPVSATVLVKVLTTHSIFRGLKLFPAVHRSYIYLPEVHAYSQINISDVKVLLYILLKEAFGTHLYNRQLLDDVYFQLEFSSATCSGRPLFHENLLSFCNGFLNLRTLAFQKANHNKFVMETRDYKYDPSLSKMPNFHTFLDEFCCNDKNRKEWIRGFLAYILLETTAEPGLFYIFGEEKSGINFLMAILYSLVGNSVVKMTFHEFNHTTFDELSLFDRKRVIVINNTVDSENHNGIAEILQTFEMFCRANVIVIGSQKLQISYYQNHHRIRSFKSEPKPYRMVQKANYLWSQAGDYEFLFQNTNYLWSGDLAKERSSIFNWLLPCRENQRLESYIINAPEVDNDSKILLDHFTTWLEKEVVGDVQAITLLGARPIGKKVKESSLFATYLKFCARCGVPEIARFKHTMFGAKILESCLKLGYTVAKKRKSDGYYITGIRIRSYILSTDLSFETQ